MKSYADNDSQRFDLKSLSLIRTTIKLRRPAKRLAWIRTVKGNIYRFKVRDDVKMTKSKSISFLRKIWPSRDNSTDSQSIDYIR